MKMKLKDAINAAKVKQRKTKYDFKYITFSDKVGPYSSHVERIVEYPNGHIRFDFAFMINKKYDYLKLGGPRVSIGIVKTK